MFVDIDDEFIHSWEASEDCRNLMTQVATDVETEWLTIVPRRTGNLAASSIVDPELVGGQWQAVLDTTAYYSAFVEFGTRYMEAQFNLREALENVTGQS